MLNFCTSVLSGKSLDSINVDDERTVVCLSHNNIFYNCDNCSGDDASFYLHFNVTIKFILKHNCRLPTEKPVLWRMIVDS